ncbi:MAG: selenocysteine-specific translation elongation factor [Deltaproteobacteria bacterium]|jgi:selenocysteine-specific elongation factor|nr:selenocysteine-specific translation elongation factor [Deltaproteobacteria bacterium]
MKQIILGTAGHIDHGKTTLIKTLTGVDLDRLKEEKARGITIQLGFTSLSLPSGQILGIVDVPGHEKFVRNMVAGVGGIDIVLFTIAADEGIMPQTREHLDICQLLKIKRGIIAVTKTDLVDEEWLQMVKDEIREFIQGSFLEKAPIIPLSSTAGQGISSLLATLDTIAQEVEERTSEGLFRLPVDRIFTMKGFGTVVTGTLIAGTIATGDSVEILPEKLEAKIRGIQVHNKQVEKASAGLRTAINLQGMDKDFLERGNVLVPLKTVTPTSRIDVMIEHLSSSSKPLKNRSRIRLHSGTSEVLAQLILLDQDELPPGGNALAQFKLERPIVVLPRDRFVIRHYSPIFTIGGGEVLDANPHKHKRLASETLAQLNAIKGGSDKENIQLFVSDSGWAGLDLLQLVPKTGKSPSQISRLLNELIQEGKLILIDKETQRVIASQKHEELKSLLLKQMKDYHKKFPLKKGIPKEELKSKLPPLIDPRLFNYLLTDLFNSSLIAVEKEKLWLHDHKPLLKDSQKELQDTIEKIYRKGGLTPPSFKELVVQLSSDERETKSIIDLLTADSIVVKVKDNLWFHRDALETLKKNLIEFLKDNGEITTPQFKELTQASRKYTIPLMEYCDQSKITIRVGEKRVLREKQR